MKNTKREYLISPYFIDSEGKMRCEKPGSLPCGRDGEGCLVWNDTWRERKTGPEFSLLVVYCKTHDKHFTVYPPGHVPHGRKAIAPEDLKTGKENLTPWMETLFEPALDDSWLGQYEYLGGPSWQTHRRRLLKAGILLGFSGYSNIGEEVSSVLCIPLHIHKEKKSLFTKGDVASQIHAIKGVLEELPKQRDIFKCMHEAAWITEISGGGWWSEPGGFVYPLFHGTERDALIWGKSGSPIHPRIHQMTVNSGDDTFKENMDSNQRRCRAP